MPDTLLRIKGTTGNSRRNAKSPLQQPLPQTPESSSTEDGEAVAGLCSACDKLNLTGLLEGEPYSRPAGLLVRSEDFHAWTRRIELPPSSMLDRWCPSCRVLNAVAGLPTSESIGPKIAATEFAASHLCTFRSYDRIYKPKSWGSPTMKSATEDESITRQQFAIYLSRTGPKNSHLLDGETFALSSSSYDTSRPLPALCGRKVSPTRVDYDTLIAWLRHCELQHAETCTPIQSERLKFIKLIDVYESRVIDYPQSGTCDYVALSYVWGDWSPKARLETGSLPENIPAGVQDAMKATKQLGKRFLWVDAFCIDQSNQSQKIGQIRMMDLVYGGAYATIINLAGTNACNGLPRVSNCWDQKPQAIEIIGDKTLVAIRPTLYEQLDKSVWASRAWTFQECILSPKRIFFTQEQVYFACNRLQCCESVDDTTLMEQDCLSNGNLPPVLIEISKTTMRNPFVSYHHLEKPQSSFALYERLVGQYTSKYMSQESDSLQALAGILSRFEDNLFPTGFTFGLPTVEFRGGPLWKRQRLILDDRRKICGRRNDFPSWSWSGWGGEVEWSPEIHWALKSTFPQPQPPLTVWQKCGSGVRKTYHSNLTPSKDIHNAPRRWTDAIQEIAPIIDDVFPILENDRILLVEGVFVTWIFDFFWADNDLFTGALRTGKKHQAIKCDADSIHTPKLLEIYNDNQPYNFLFLHAHSANGQIYHMSFLALEWQGDVAHRRALIELDTDKPEALLKTWNPHMRRIKLG